MSESKWRYYKQTDQYVVDRPQPLCDLPSGTYTVTATEETGFGLSRVRTETDGLFDIPNVAIDSAVTSIQKFWDSKTTYNKYGLVYKRGILLYGPPGSGKTVVVRKICDRIEEMGGVAIIGGHPHYTVQGIRMFRETEPDRPIVVQFEDIDVLVRQHGEKPYLGLLDGELQFQNVVYVATTNYIERLSPALINRPSRFDERIFVGMPKRSARALYLQNVSTGELSDEAVATWTKDTVGFSFAHLRELYVSVHCLGNKYEDTLERLKKLQTRPAGSETYIDFNDVDESQDDFDINFPTLRYKPRQGAFEAKIEKLEV